MIGISTAKASSDDRANASPRHDQRSSSDERLREGAESQNRNHPRSSYMKGLHMFDPTALKRLAAERTEWESKELAEFLARQPEARTDYRTGSGMPVQR